MSDSSNNDDDLLLLTMRVETDENSLSELNKRMLALRETMQDTAKTIDLSDWATSLGAAVQALRAAVNAWNSLEDKAISVATNRNYLPYGISAGEAESINTKIDANKIAQQTGLSSGGVLSSLINISEEQQNVVGLGHDPNQDNWVALYELGRALGDDRFTGSNLSHLLTEATSVEVLTTISDLLVKANRKAYSTPEGSEQRQSWIKMINKVQDSPYVPANLETYLALMTKPENQTWGKSGDPFKQLISGTPEDIGNYNKNIEEESAKSLSIHSALSDLKTEREEFWNRTGTSAYNLVGENVILPLSNTVTTLAKAVSGKAMSNMPFEGYNALDYMLLPNPYAKAKMEKDKFSSSALLDETGTSFKGDLKARAAQAKQYATDTVFKVDLYELAKAALVRNVTSKMTYSEGKKQGKQLSNEDAYAAAEEMLTSEDSPYTQEYKSGGFPGLYSALYKNQVLTDKEYRTLVERASTETEHKELNKSYNNEYRDLIESVSTETEHKEPNALYSDVDTNSKGTAKARAAQAKQYSKGMEDALLGELGLYELAKMSQADFNVQSVTAMLYARDALVRNVTGKLTYSEGKKQGKKLSGEDAYAAAEEMLTSEDSSYVQAYKSGGFTGLYSELYKNQALTDKEYLDLMERVINETKHKELNKFYGDVDKNSEVTADVRKVDGKNVLRLELTVKDEKTGEVTTQKTDLTPDQVSSLRLNLGL